MGVTVNRLILNPISLFYIKNDLQEIFFYAYVPEICKKLLQCKKKEKDQ